MDWTGYRKLIFGSVILVIGLAIAFVKGDVPAGVLQLLEVVFGAFVVGNASEHISNAMAPAEVAPATAPVDMTPIVQALQTMQTQAEQTQNAVANAQKGISAIIGIATGNRAA